MIRAGDIILIATSVLLISLLATLLWQDGAVTGIDIHGEGFSERHAADAQGQVHVSGPLGETVIEINDGRARIVSSPCTRKLCVRRGWLDEAGEVAACLPNRVSIALAGDARQFDAVSF